MPQSRLRKAGKVTLDASGEGRVRLSPETGPPVWQVLRMAVQTDRRGQPPIPQCAIYLNEESPLYLQDGTYDGSFDFSDCDITVTKGDDLIAVWTGGQSGDEATFTVTGWAMDDR